MGMTRLVCTLLERGYSVHATVKDLNDEKETKHLRALEGAEKSLKLFEMDLLDYDSITAAINGTDGVFHLASPNITDPVQDPEKELLEPAIKGTENVLAAAKQVGVRRVVVTSSTTAITASPDWPAHVVKREDCWSDVDYCRQNDWCIFDVVTICPGMVLGPIIPPSLCSSFHVILRLIKGSTDPQKDMYMGCVHVNDVALAHVLAYENPNAKGRHLCVESISHFSDFAAKLDQLYPEFKVPKFIKDTQPEILRAEDGAKKLIGMEIKFIPMEKIINDSVEALRNKGFLN